MGNVMALVTVSVGEAFSQASKKKGEQLRELSVQLFPDDDKKTVEARSVFDCTICCVVVAPCFGLSRYFTT